MAKLSQLTFNTDMEIQPPSRATGAVILPPALKVEMSLSQTVELVAKCSEELGSGVFPSKHLKFVDFTRTSVMDLSEFIVRNSELQVD